MDRIYSSLKQCRILIIYNHDYADSDSSEESGSSESEEDSFQGNTARANIYHVAHHIRRTLLEQNYFIVELEAIKTILDVRRVINQKRYDLIINLCESLHQDSSSEVEVVKILEQYGVPFTGNPSRTLELCLNKYECSQVLKEARIGVPASYLISNLKDLKRFVFLLQNNDSFKEWSSCSFPLIVKPNQEDGSTGIDTKAVVYDIPSLEKQVEKLLKKIKDTIVVQEFIDGREFSVSLLGHLTPILGISEIDFDGLPKDLPKILNYASKWNPLAPEFSGSKSVLPDISPLLTRKIVDQVKRAAEVLGLNSYGRIDIRLDHQEIPYIIDVNPNCDLDPEAGLAKTAFRRKIPYSDLIDRILYSTYKTYYYEKNQERVPLLSVSKILGDLSTRGNFELIEKLN